MHHLAKRSLVMCEHTGGVLRDFVVVIHRDICRQHSLIGRRNCRMTEAANSPSAAAGPELSTTRNPIANLASDSATAGLAWVRVCVLWRPGASVRRTQAERWLYCATPCVGMIFTKPGFQSYFAKTVQLFFFWFSPVLHCPQKQHFFADFEVKLTTGTTSTSQFFL